MFVASFGLLRAERGDDSDTGRRTRILYPLHTVSGVVRSRELRASKKPLAVEKLRITSAIGLLEGQGRMEAHLPPPTLGEIRSCCSEYRRVFGRFPNLLRPQRFTEKMQWRKLFDLNPLYAVLSDKIAARDFIAARVGAQWLPPLLWTGDSPNDIPFERMKPPYILKCNHGCGFNIIATSSTKLDREDTRQKLGSLLTRNFGKGVREPGYMPIRPRLLAEHLMLETDGSPPHEHKIMVFDGRARFVWTIVVNRDRSRFDAFHTLDWRPLGWRFHNQRHEGELPRPEQLDKFIELAEAIGTGFDHIRVDFYEWNNRPIVGELTLYSQSGLNHFFPDNVDFTLGHWWKLPRPACRAVTPAIRGLPETCHRLFSRSVSSGSSISQQLT